MNYQDVKTFQELAEAIKEHIDSHRIPCTDVLRREGVMYVNAKTLSTTDARLAFVRLKNKFGVEVPVPDDLIELLDSCGVADRKLQDKLKPKKPVGKAVTLLQFMQTHCEEQQLSLLRCRRKSLNDAHNRGAIKLPELAREWKSGQSKYYKANDLIAKWPSYCDALPNLPSLKQ